MENREPADVVLTRNVPLTNQRHFIVGILFITLLVAYLDRVNVSVLLADPQFLSDMGITDQPVKMGLLMTLFLVAYGISNAVLGPVGDILGPRIAMCTSIGLWGLSMILGGFATTFGTMLGMRVLLGAGEGMHWPMQMKYVKNWFPPRERAKANGLWLVGLLLGPAVAMPLFTWMISVTNWRVTFLVLVLISFIPLWLLWFFTTDHPRQNKKVSPSELDYIETGLAVEAKEEEVFAKASTWENMKVFILDYRYWLVTIYYFCHCSIWWGTMAWLPSYLKVARGFSWTEMGAWATFPYILGAIVIILSGIASDKVGRRDPFPVAAMIISSSCLYGGAYASSNTMAAFLISIGIASICLATPAIWTIVQQIVPTKSIGAGSGLMNGLANGGSALAPVLMGYFISMSGSYVSGLLFLVGLAVLGGVSMLILALQRY